MYLLGFITGFFIAGLLFYPAKKKKVERYPKVSGLRVNEKGKLKL